jgi:hypothetical protein
VAPKKKESKERVKPVLVKAEKTPPPPPPAEKPAKKSKFLPWLLSVVCLLLVGAVIYLLASRQTTGKQDQTASPYVPNAGEQKLSDTLFQLTGDTLSLLPSAFASAITLGKTVEITRDTLYILGNNTVLAADSTFAGPAVTVAANNKVLSLENLVFQNFDTAVLLQGKGVRLKNVRFVNCKVPVQHNLLLAPDSALNGFVRDTFIVSRNSLPK